MPYPTKVLAALLLAVIAGPAAAANWQSSGTGNGELFAVIYDSVTHDSYIKDLNLTYSDLATNGSTAGYSLSYNISADSTYGSFLSAVGASASLYYYVIAGDDVGRNYQFTSAVTPLLSPNKNVSVNNLGATLQGWMSNDALYSAITGSAAGSVWTTPSVSYNPGNALAIGDQWNGSLLSTSMAAAINTATSFWTVSRSNSNNALAPKETQFGSAAGAAIWNLARDASGNVTLSYSVPVPEPGTWALMAIGLLLLAGVARRRASA